MRARLLHGCEDLFNTSVEMPVGKSRTDAIRPVFMRCSPICTGCCATVNRGCEVAFRAQMCVPRSFQHMCGNAGGEVAKGCNSSSVHAVFSNLHWTRCCLRRSQLRRNPALVLQSLFRKIDIRKMMYGRLTLLQNRFRKINVS